MPVDDMHAGEKTTGWELLMDRLLRGEETEDEILQCTTLPFSHFAYRFTAEPTGPQLLQVYTRLYRLAKKAVDDFVTSHPGQLRLDSTAAGGLPISYNLAMTTEGVAILPRRSEGYMLRREDGTDVGYVQLNGTALGGTLMVKYEEEWDVLRAQPQKLDVVLEAIGIPKPGQEAVKL